MGLAAGVESVPARGAGRAVFGVRHHAPARAAHHGGQLPIDGHEPVIGQLIVAQRTGPEFFAFAARVGNDVALGVPVSATALWVDVDAVDHR